MQALLISFTVIFGIFLGGQAGYAERPAFAPMRLTIETSNGQILTFNGELAQRSEELAYGLKFRTELADDYAMAFDLGQERRALFWMKDTYVPLDIIFVRSDGRIESTIAHVPPLSLEARHSQGRVRYVIEIKAGLTERYGISEGDRVTIYKNAELSLR